MTIVQLEYIVALDTYRHFVTASEKCFVTQPTLSMQIQKLESELEVLIFDRSKQPVEPTPVGQEIIRRARQILREVKGTKDFVKAEKGILEGELKIGIIPTLAPYLIPLFLTNLLEKYPTIKPVIEELQTEELVDKLKKGLLDLGILVTPLEEKNLAEIALFEELFVAYLSENHPLLDKERLQTGDLMHEDLWILNQGHCFRNQVVNICGMQQEKERSFIYESGSLETLRKMVEQKSGCTLLPQLAVADIRPERQHLLRYFEEPQPARKVSMVVHNSFLKIKLVEVLREEILNHLPEEVQVTTQKKKKTKIIDWR